jgi:hypothetical protein
MRRPCFQNDGDEIAFFALQLWPSLGLAVVVALTLAQQYHWLG